MAINHRCDDRVIAATGLNDDRELGICVRELIESAGERCYSAKVAPVSVGGKRKRKQVPQVVEQATGIERGGVSAISILPPCSRIILSLTGSPNPVPRDPFLDSNTEKIFSRSSSAIPGPLSDIATIQPSIGL